MTDSSYVHFYVRVSHRQSAESGLSESAQLSAQQHYYRQSRLQLTIGRNSYPYDLPSGVFSDRGTSAWKHSLADRPAGSMLLENVSPGDHIVFYSIDRAFRNVGDYGKTVDSWLKQNITPHFVANGLDLSTAAGRLMGNFHATWAQYYSDIISERTKEALAIKRLTGKAKEPDRAMKWKWEKSGIIIPSQKQISRLTTGQVYMYCRCSKLDQTLSGLGMEVQREGNLRYASNLVASDPGLSLSNEVLEDDSISSFSIPFRERPAGKRLFEKLQPGDKVVIYRLDRGFRNELDALRTVQDLLDRQVEIHLASEGIHSGSEMGITWFTLMVAFASLESRIKSRRSKDVNSELRKQGRPLGQVPAGTKVVALNGRKSLTYDKASLTESFMGHFLMGIGLNGPEVCSYMAAVHAQQKKLKPRSKYWAKAIDKYKGQNFWRNRLRVDKMIQQYPEPVLKESAIAAVQVLATPIEYPYNPKITTHDVHANFCLKSPEETAEIMLGLPA